MIGITRIILTLCLIYFVYVETGWATALFCFLVAFLVEAFLCWVVVVTRTLEYGGRVFQNHNEAIVAISLAIPKIVGVEDDESR